MSVGALLAWLEEQAKAWILGSRDAHRPLAQMLHADVRAHYEPFFEGRELDVARWRVVPVIEDPPFVAEAEMRGIPRGIEFSRMAGITFQDTVLLSEREMPSNPEGLVFHELIHVVQYELLGVEEFVRQYIRGFLAGGLRYETIPLERDAYELQARFESGEGAFSVKRELQRRWAAGEGRA